MRGLILAITIFAAACTADEEPVQCEAELIEHQACQAYVDATPEPADGCLLTYIIWLRCMADCNEWDCDPRGIDIE